MQIIYLYAMYIINFEMHIFSMVGLLAINDNVTFLKYSQGRRLFIMKKSADKMKNPLLYDIDFWM